MSAISKLVAIIVVAAALSLAAFQPRPAKADGGLLVGILVGVGVAAAIHYHYPRAWGPGYPAAYTTDQYGRQCGYNLLGMWTCY